MDKASGAVVAGNRAPQHGGAPSSVGAADIAGSKRTRSTTPPALGKAAAHAEDEHAPLDETEDYEGEHRHIRDDDEESGSEPELEHDISEEEGDEIEDDTESAVLAAIAKRRTLPIHPHHGLAPSPTSSYGSVPLSAAHQASLSQAAIISGLSSMSHNRRQAHIASEQKRRQSINDGFEDLRRAVPSCMSASDSKAVILRKAVNYIRQLQSELVRLKGGPAGPQGLMSPPASYGHHGGYPDNSRSSPTTGYTAPAPTQLARNYIAPSAPQGYMPQHMQPVHGVPVPSHPSGAIPPQHHVPSPYHPGVAPPPSQHHMVPPPPSHHHMPLPSHHQMAPPAHHYGPPPSQQPQHALPSIHHQYGGYHQGYGGHVSGPSTLPPPHQPLPQPMPHVRPSYATPPYNRDDYASAASLSMLRQDTSGSNTPTEQHLSEAPQH